MKIHDEWCAVYARVYPQRPCNCVGREAPLSDPSAVVIECEPPAERRLLGLPPVFVEGGTAERYPMPEWWSYSEVDVALDKTEATMSDPDPWIRVDRAVFERLRAMEATMAGEQMAVNPVQPRFCVDCRHHEMTTVHTCMRPIMDPVTGEVMVCGVNAYTERSGFEQQPSLRCGPDARFFEPK